MRRSKSSQTSSLATKSAVMLSRLNLAVMMVTVVVQRKRRRKVSEWRV